jgi:catechol 2,3-dioxygenase-like lactoylglutathione lyase family enzyme
MRRLVQLLVTGLLLWHVAATPAQPADKSIRPSLVAISVANLDAAIKWYETNLDFTLKEKKEFPQHGLRIAFLELNGFELELVEDEKSISLAAIQKNLPEADDEAKIQGLVKLAFTVDDIDSLNSKLKANGVKFQMDLSKSNRQEGVRYIVVRDSDGNWIQLFGK